MALIHPSIYNWVYSMYLYKYTWTFFCGLSFRVHKLIEDGITNNVVKPLKHRVFHRGDVESAFRYMAEGEHIGKIVIQVNLICIKSHLILHWDGLVTLYYFSSYFCSRWAIIWFWIYDADSNSIIICSSMPISTLKMKL